MKDSKGKEEKFHTMPADLQKAVNSSISVKEAWKDITPIARNEWICWVTSVKKAETRKEHIERAVEQLKEGKCRPCCWPGCPHRNPNAKKWFSKK